MVYSYACLLQQVQPQSGNSFGRKCPANLWPDCSYGRPSGLGEDVENEAVVLNAFNKEHLHKFIMTNLKASPANIHSK